jgi:hypothetical protein
MRPLLAALLAMLLVPLAARSADDTRPPAISDVRATQRGGQVHIEARITDETGVLMATCHYRSGAGRWADAPMTKNDYDDVFKVSFGGGPDTEYWIESSDLLGNGPSTYGAAAKPVAVGTSSPKEAHAQRERPEPPAKRREQRLAKAASSKAGPPVIEHRKPGATLPEGKEVTLRARVRGEAPIAFSGVFLRKQGDSSTPARLALNRVEGETYEAKIPADKARGNIEYLLAAKDENGKQSFGGDGSPSTWFAIAFKPAQALEQPFRFAVNPPARVNPGRSLTVRAQITTPGDEPTAPGKAQVLWRGSDGQEQVTEMQADASGGLGGFKAELPPQRPGAVYYQVVACDPSGSKCAVSTGSKRKWHAVAIAAAPGAKPAAIDAASSKAPGSLPE